LFFFFVAPPVPFLPAHVHGRPVVAVVACWSGPFDEGEATLQPLRDFGAPLADTIAPMPYTAMQRLIESGAVPRQKNYWKAGFFSGVGRRGGGAHRRAYLVGDDARPLPRDFPVQWRRHPCGARGQRLRPPPRQLRPHYRRQVA